MKQRAKKQWKRYFMYLSCIDYSVEPTAPISGVAGLAASQYLGIILVFDWRGMQDMCQGRQHDLGLSAVGEHSVLIQGDKILLVDFSISHDGLFQPYRSSNFFPGAATLARL
jgi:hypothetical protein